MFQALLIAAREAIEYIDYRHCRWGFSQMSVHHPDYLYVSRKLYEYERRERSFINV